MTSLTVALPLLQGIDNRIQFLLTQYMTEINVWTRQIFGNAQYSYIKDDINSKERPGIFIYPLHSEKNSFAYSQNGRVIMELHFNFQEQRTNLAQNVIQIANDIQLINLNQQFTQYLQQFMPGIFWFGKYCKVDYTRVYAKESVVKIEFDYNIDLQAYQNELQVAGYDITSPDELIYVPAFTIMESLAILRPNNVEEIAFITN